jgi:hypothetical protein
VVTDKYKYQLDEIRNYFIAKYKTEREELPKSIFIFVSEGVESRAEKTKAKLIDWSFGRGGILETVELLNNYLSGLIGLLLFVLISKMQVSSLNIWNVSLSIIIFILLFLVTWYIQTVSTHRLYTKEEEEAENKNKIKYKKWQGIRLFGPS